MTPRRVALFLVVLLVSLTTPMPGASTQEATGSIALASQTPFRTPGQPFTMTIRIRTASPTGLEIAVGTYRRLGSRSEFVNAIEGRLATRTPTDLVRVPLDQVTLDDDGNSVVTIEPRSSREGVYPVRVELRDNDGDVVDGFTTFLVSIPTVVEADPIDLALVVPVHAAPAVRPDGTVELDPERADAIAEVASVLSRWSDIPVTLAPTPETLEALLMSTRAADRDTAIALARASIARQVAPSTYVPTDLSAIVAADLNDELDAQLARGTKTIRDVMGVPPAEDLRLVDERLTDAALESLDRRGVERLVVRESQLDPVRLPNDLTLTGQFTISTRGTTFQAAAADEGLAAHFQRDVPPALGAAHLIADAAVLWLDLPGRSTARRGVIAMASRSWRPDPAFLDAVMAGVRGNPIFAPVTINGFFDAVAPARLRNQQLVRSFKPVESGSGLNASAIRSARRQLRGFASIVAADNPDLDVFERALLISQSGDLRPSARASYLRTVDRRIDEQLDQIDMPQSRSITLTAREGELPVTITNQLPYPISVVVTLESDALDFPAGSSRRLELARQNTTERFEVHARGSGSFPVRVRVTAPDGELVVAESRFTVRSTAVSGVGIALSVGAALFLVVWWASHLRSRRRRRSTTASSSA
ncbi:MAG TPA: DUF6049 family protein [Acidimicrobiales bacterium]|jgi:hypothetical protein|nr:DUF6049 family protein [Acidimicrobiales bacterium]